MKVRKEMGEEVTTPPCLACNAHDQLEDRMKKSDKLNTEQHREILKGLDRATGNIHWQNVIGKWVLATVIGYLVGMIYYVVAHHIDSEDIAKITKSITQGEKLHYENENQISNINGKLDIVIKEVTKK